MMWGLGGGTVSRNQLTEKKTRNHPHKNTLSKSSSLLECQFQSPRLSSLSNHVSATDTPPSPPRLGRHRPNSEFAKPPASLSRSVATRPAACNLNASKLPRPSAVPLRPRSSWLTGSSRGSEATDPRAHRRLNARDRIVPGRMAHARRTNTPQRAIPPL